MASSTRLGIVLAAGDGERMGGSKALLLLDGEPLAQVHARRLREAGCRRVVIVVRATVERSGQGHGHVYEHDCVVVSEACDPAGSLAVGVRAAGVEGGTIVVITPVDAAPVRGETVAALVRVVEGGALAATPRYRGRGGHPVVCRAEVLDAYLRVQPSYPPLRDTLAKLGDGRVRVDVDDPGITVDLDTPADVEALTGAPPTFWRP